MSRLLDVSLIFFGGYAPKRDRRPARRVTSKWESAERASGEKAPTTRNYPEAVRSGRRRGGGKRVACHLAAALRLVDDSIL
jgi:hypothetical protein